jgi:prophage DNA circulation protein
MTAIKITNIPNTPWRDKLLPASFRGVMFHVEAGSQSNGRRIVVHEFPKRDIPYPEDMGRSAKQFNVRGYVIMYPFDTNLPLYSRDYTKARDALIAALETNGPASLQLPTIAPIVVVNSQYRWTEEQRLGGYCTFDMTFVEYGNPSGLAAQPSGSAQLIDASNALKQQVLSVMGKIDAVVKQRMLATPPPPR